MKVNITRIDEDLPLPQRETEGAVAFDLFARIEISVKPKEIQLIPLNAIVEIPRGYMLVIASRSSLPRKKGLSVANGIGIIDQDFHGPEDELKLQVINFTDKDVKVLRGERIAQGMFVPIEHPEWQENEIKKQESRGEFGSTGGYKDKT